MIYDEKVGLRVLQAKVRGFHSSGTRIAKRIHAARAERRQALWTMKRSLGMHARVHMVAYGLLRGVPYEDIERCRPENKLNPQQVLDIMLEHAGYNAKRAELTIESLTTMLTVTDGPRQRQRSGFAKTQRCRESSTRSIPPTIAPDRAGTVARVIEWLHRKIA